MGYPVDEFMDMYSEALQKYVWFRFVGTYMDQAIKPVFADLPRGKFACAADYSEVYALEPLEQLQSMYYSTRTVRILVIVSVRHAVFELDEEESQDDFIPVFENWFLCADGVDLKQNWAYSEFGLKWVAATMIERAASVEKMRIEDRERAKGAADAALGQLRLRPDVPESPTPADPPSALITGWISASDQCAEQFRSLHTVLGQSRLPKIVLDALNAPARALCGPLEMLWLWAGTGYFKWRHDTAGGWFKRHASAEVLKGKMGYFHGNIEGAQNLVEYGLKRHAKPEQKAPKAPKPDATLEQKERFQRRVRENHFKYLSKADIDAAGSLRADKASAVDGIMKLHGLTSKSTEPGVCLVCERPCTCLGCRHGDGLPCERLNHRSEWHRVEMRAETASARNTRRRGARDEAPFDEGPFDGDGESDDESEGDGDEPPAREAVLAALVGGANVMFINHGNPDMEYYVAQLAPDPWTTVEADQVTESCFDEHGEPLRFRAGERVLRGYFYSLRRSGARHYELHDATYARTVSAAVKSSQYSGWPEVLFRQDMVLHVGFHMTPTMSSTSRSQRWYALDSADHEAALAAHRDLTA